MRIDILTLFPELFEPFLNTSIIKRARAANAVTISTHNIRQYTTDKYGRVDDYPVGGGAGLVMKCQPIVDCLKQIHQPHSKVILLSPRGQTFSQPLAHQMAREIEHLILICGHYEGVDERLNRYIDGMVSIGDFILTGGEIAAMAMSDAITRLLEGAIAEHSLHEESFENGLLEYPQYALPREYEGAKIPDILFSGNHEAIKQWRHQQSMFLTKQFRPDLWQRYPVSAKELKLLEQLENDSNTPDWVSKAITKAAKFMK